MKRKKIMASLIVSLVLFVMGIAAASSARAWGNQTWFDTTYTFDWAIINIGDRIIEGKVQSWHDFENSDVVQVKIDGKVYLTHYSNMVLISE